MHWNVLQTIPRMHPLLAATSMQRPMLLRVRKYLKHRLHLPPNKLRHRLRHRLLRRHLLPPSPRRMNPQRLKLRLHRRPTPR